VESITKRVLLERRKHYTETRKQYEYLWYSAEVDHKELSPVSVESQIEGYIGEEEARHIVILQN